MLRMEKDEDLEKFLVQEEKSFSESSSGFQSGWTLYLATSTSLPPTRDSSTHEQEEEEEDLSMLSDASSGPPHTHTNKNDCFNFYYCSNVEDDCISSSPILPVTTFSKNEGKKQKQRRNQEESSFLDDSASSPLLCFSKARPHLRGFLYFFTLCTCS
ncbi:hypothetical protein IEQ34_003377 [Dendrobium chrysotoxum]|uniref:Uncharacterized protein n=1 Tax=Dendrobium chrysotoxum TaxID=161865 RepID=A0AAV7H3K5_DENCH|nr:hypothetical protein IEQ34_003377 [Dendrobium chrysotoxum]